MQTTYGTRGRKAKENRAKRAKQQQTRQLLQLLFCLSVFLAVFIGKGVWPTTVAQTGTQLLQVIRANTDFRAAFARLGAALSQQESMLGEIGDFCVSVLAPVQQPAAQEAASEPEQPVQLPPVEPELPLVQPQEPIMLVGDVVQETTAQDLPEGYTGQWLYLGELQTVTPVKGTITSPFGYREHPTKGRYAAHAGVDIAADHGTAVACFADGVVAEVGQNDDFGRYLLVDHPNGVSTFYSHCHAVLAEKGDEVTVGQIVAQVGSTGQSTGAHLHFEVRLNGVRLDPLYYIAPGQEV